MDKILFIGNSYTFFNDMPKLFEALSTENGKKCEVISLTKGGRKLFSNFETEDEFAISVKNTSVNDNYSVVILQDQSLIAIDAPDDLYKGIAYHVNAFKAERKILYATWGRKEGSDKLEERSITSAEMTARIAKEYASVAKRLNVEVSNVGLAFAYIKEHYPNIELYDPDKSHPSYNGSCLAALVHYRTVFGDLPQKLDSLKLDRNVISAFTEAIND